MHLWECKLLPVTISTINKQQNNRMKTALNIKSNVKAGFSLVEMLVVIAVIGIMAAIAIPTIGNMTASAKANKDKRNAQNVASVWSAAVAAGYTVTETTEQAAVDKLQGGITAAENDLGSVFKCDLTDAEEAGAIAKLTLADGLLTYAP